MFVEIRSSLFLGSSFIGKLRQVVRRGCPSVLSSLIASEMYSRKANRPVYTLTHFVKTKVLIPRVRPMVRKIHKIVEVAVVVTANMINGQRRLEKLRLFATADSKLYFIRERHICLKSIATARLPKRYLFRLRYYCCSPTK